MAWFSRHTLQPAKRTARRLNSIAAAALIILATLVLVVFLFADPLLNNFAKGKIEEAFAKAYPGYEIHIGSLHFNILNNYSECRGVSLATSDSSIGASAGSMSIRGIGWQELLFRRKLTPELVRNSILNADDILLRITKPGFEIHCAGIRIAAADSEITARSALWEFKQARYRLQCGSVRISARDSEITAGQIEFAPLAGDDDFFDARPFRRTRFMLKLSQCRLTGAAVPELLQGTAYTARRLECDKPELGMLVNRDKNSDPNSPPPVMPGEALARLKRTLHLDTLMLHNGQLLYEERLSREGKHGAITFDSVELAAVGISNSGNATARMRGHGRFLGAGTMSIDMEVALPPHGVSISYTGSLSAMDMTALNHFLPIAEHVQVTSGMLHNASFEIHVANGRGTGKLKLLYDKLYVTMLDEATGKKNVLGKRLETIIANLVKLHKDNMPDTRGAFRTGDVKYESESDDSFMNIVWLSLRSAVQDVVGF